MRYLLDTHLLLWVLEGNRKKLAAFLDLIENTENYIAVSIVSYWEIVIKKSLGKLTAPPLIEIMEAIDEAGFSFVSLEPKHIKCLEKLPLLHNDPFDRLLVAQATVDQLHVLTVDSKILSYFPDGKR